MGEELGASTALHFGFRARYRTALENGLVENEIVYVYFGAAPRKVAPNPDEVMTVATMGLKQLNTDITRHPRRYAYWLRYYLKNHYAAIARSMMAELGRT